MGKLTGRYAIVTGSGKGIGKAIVQRFLEDDVAGVALFDMDEELVKATAKELDPTGERAIAVRCNVANMEDVIAAVQIVTEKFGRVDILINNAGITRDAMFHKMTSEQAHMVMDVNFFGTFNCCQAVIKGMRDRCYGKIVNISSVSTFGSVGQTNYSASKAAIEGFTRTLAMESGLKNITVYAHSGLNVRSIYDDACIDTEDEKIIILEALRRNPDFKKIYLKMGTNELGWPYYDVFIKEYTALIEQIKDICPDALIYVHSILPVAKKKSEIDPYENQPNINRCNELLQEMCAENGYFYLDVQSVYLDEEGYLLSSVTFDGSHIRYPHYPQWVEYLLSHTFEGCNMILPADDAEENNENIAPGDTEQLSGLPQNNGQQNDMQPSAE